MMGHSGEERGKLIQKDDVKPSIEKFENFYNETANYL